jgi:hypothetical protein
MKVKNEKEFAELFVPDFTGFIECCDGNNDAQGGMDCKIFLQHFKDGKWHREDGPAVVWFSETQFWMKDGLRHRENGPACIWNDGGKSWYLNGEHLKSEDGKGPAEGWDDSSW